VAELIVFPDVEQLLIDYLTPSLAVPVGTAVPNPRPTSFVTVNRFGGPRRGLVVDDAQLGFEYWAERESQAAQLAQLVRAHINALQGQRVNGVQVYRVREFAGPANLPDPLSGQPRYVQQFGVQVRGTAL